MERGIVKSFRLTDERTGESYKVGVISSKRKGRGNWMKLMLEPMKALALLEPPLRGETCRVLFYLLGTMRWGNEVPGLEVVAKALRMKGPSVARAYRQLREAGILMKTERTYNLNPMVGWKGTDSGFQAACERLLGAHEGRLLDKGSHV